MKTTSVASPVGLNVILLALLIAVIAFIAVTGKKSSRTFKYAHGYSSSTGSWHGNVYQRNRASCCSSAMDTSACYSRLPAWRFNPGDRIEHYLNWKLPFIQSDAQAILVVVILMGLKVVNTLVHSLFASGA